MKIGSTNVASFRLGEITPGKVYLGSNEVWTGISAPAAPSASMSVSGIRQLLLTWDAPDDGGSPITGYLISYYTTAGGSTLYTESVGIEPTSYTFTDAEAGQNYYVTVAAVNAIGTGAASDPVDSTTADPPSAPSWMSAAASAYEPGAIAIGFTSGGSDGGSPVTQYEVEYDTGEGFSTASSQVISAEATDYTITGLQGGGSYYLRLRAQNAAGNGEWSVYGSNPVAASASVPGVPTGLTVTANNATGNWDVSWTEPNDGGSAITGYELEEVDVDYSDLNNAYLYSSGSSLSYTANDTDQTRYIRIRASNAAGDGEWTEYVSAYFDTSFSPMAVMLTSGSSYAVPAGATSVKAWAIGAGATPSFTVTGGAGGVVYKTWTAVGGDVTYEFSGYTSITYDSTTIQGFNGSDGAGGSYSGGDGGASGGDGSAGYGGSGYMFAGGAVGSSGAMAEQAACGRYIAADVDGLFAALALAGVNTTENCASEAAFGSGAHDAKYSEPLSAGIGGGGILESSGLSITGQAGGAGAVVLYFT